jgi:hypothetical protein
MLLSFRLMMVSPVTPSNPPNAPAILHVAEDCALGAEMLAKSSGTAQRTAILQRRLPPLYSHSELIRDNPSVVKFRQFARICRVNRNDKVFSAAAEVQMPANQ